MRIGGAWWEQAYATLVERRKRTRNEARKLKADPAPTGPGDAATAALQARVAAQGWYHSIDLGNGVVTPGEFDHRHHLQRYRIPERLDGKRVLDIGTFDGFWAFEFERRGASQVVALDLDTFGDLDLPPRARDKIPAEELAAKLGRGFVIAHAALGSRVERRIGSVYTMAAEQWGTYDLTHIGNVLVHLRDPAHALARMRGVTRGTAIISETVDPDLDWQPGVSLIEYRGGTVNCNWWRFGEQSLVQMVRDAGFDDVRVVARFDIPLRDSARNMHQIVINAAA
ncbi:MAG: methyltransferase domain-containing protein [Alphaproteobacteria bacterium]|nr:methyltransferase domain-containing protein [Alphaproteobacteria bacterium]